MYRLRRGVPSDSSDNSPLAMVLNPVSSEVTRYSLLLEEYRQLLSGVPDAELQRVGVQQVAARLRPDEAVLSVVAGHEQCLVMLVTASDSDSPAVGTLLDDWNLATDAQINDGVCSGWLYSLAILDPAFDRAPALDSFIEKFDAALAPRIKASIEEHGIRRLTVIPHDFMRLAPFWALPCLRDLQVTLEICAATFLDQGANLAARISNAAVVSDPLLDLPAALADTSAVIDALSAFGLPIDRLQGLKADRSNLQRVLKQTDWLHYSGHGHIPLTDPLEASLLLNPAWGSSKPESADEFWSISTAASDDPPVMIDGKGRIQIAGIGVLEELGDAACRERFLHCDDGRTLWGTADEAKRGCVADRYCAAQLLSDADEHMPKVANLATCSLGASGFTDVEEWQGLVAAFHLAGVNSIIAGLWPVSDVAAAVFVQLFYQEMREYSRDNADGSVDVDLCAALSEASHKMSTLSRDLSASLLQRAARRERAASPREALQLELIAVRMREADEYPFTSAYQHAAFYLLGQSRVTLPRRPL
uniref:CHAT domain-containing protein n=1 Tax=Marinobacterium profundum TaxID=1714300 RepID=UPI0009E7F82E|nr:CHAT domain-containing protein [Marinobacterium profundum]